MKNKIILLITLLILLTTTSYALTFNDFNDYFLKDNGFNGKIVIGEKAQASDVIGAIDVAIGLQLELQQPEELIEDSSKKFQIKNNDDFLQAAENLSSVIEKVDETMFQPLATGTLRNDRGTFEYKQYLTLPNAMILYKVADGVPDDEEHIPSGLVQFNEDSPAYEYQLSFSTPLESEIDTDMTLKDLKDKEITILGAEYTIISTEHKAKNDITLTLFGGSIEAMMKEYETRTFTLEGKEYEIEVVAISYDGEVILKINGENTEKLGEGDIYRLNDGTEIGIKELLENEGSELGGEDIVTFYLGASKITLRDDNITDGLYSGDEYEVSDKKVEDTDVKIIGTDEYTAGGLTKIESIYVKWTPDDNYYLAENDKLSDILEDKNQLFTKNWDYLYEGIDLDNEFETIKINPSGDDEYWLEFQNRAGEDLKIPLYYDNGSTLQLGSEDDTLHIVEGVPINKGDLFIVTSDGYEGMQKADGFTHLLEYKSLDISDKIIEFKNLGSGDTIEVSFDSNPAQLVLYGNSYDVTYLAAVDDAPLLIDLDNSGDLGDPLNDSNIQKVPLVTKYGHNLDIDIVTFDKLTFISKEKQGSELLDAFNAVLYNVVGPTVQAMYALPTNPVIDTSSITTPVDTVKVEFQDVGGEIDISDVWRGINANPQEVMEGCDPAYGYTVAYTVLVAFMDTVPGGIYDAFSNSPNQFLYEVGESDTYEGSTGYGQIATYDKRDSQDTVKIVSSDKEEEHILDIISSEYVPNEKSSSSASRIPSAVLDTKMKNPEDYNLILIGGPCVNTIARDMLQLTQDTCADPFPANTGRLKIMQNRQNIAVLAAGLTADDTLKSTSVLAYMDDYTLDGDDLAVTGTQPNLNINTFKASSKTTAQPEKIETVEVIKSCEYPSSGTREADLEIKKLLMTAGEHVILALDASGNKVEISLDPSTSFRPRLGIDWFSAKVNIHQNNCDGPIVASADFKWENKGDKLLTQTVTLPSEGCYCARITNNEVDIDDAEIEITTNNGIVELPFSTE